MQQRTSVIRQPDDPGDSTTLTPGIVRFVPQPFGRETAAIGSNPVGSIEPQDWGKLRRATWRCALFEGGLAARADTNAKAKVALLHKIADWHDLGRTGLRAIGSSHSIAGGRDHAMRDRRLTPEQRSARQREAYARWRAKNESIRAVREQGTGDVMFPHGVRNGTTPNSVLIERERATASRLSITAALMGDPLPGRSALDKKQRSNFAEIVASGGEP